MAFKVYTFPGNWTHAIRTMFICLNVQCKLKRATECPVQYLTIISKINNNSAKNRSLKFQLPRFVCVCVYVHHCENEYEYGNYLVQSLIHMIMTPTVSYIMVQLLLTDRINIYFTGRQNCTNTVKWMKVLSHIYNNAGDS